MTATTVSNAISPAPNTVELSELESLLSMALLSRSYTSLLIALNQAVQSSSEFAELSISVTPHHVIGQHLTFGVMLGVKGVKPPSISPPKAVFTRSRKNTAVKPAGAAVKK